MISSVNGLSATRVRVAQRIKSVKPMKTEDATSLPRKESQGTRERKQMSMIVEGGWDKEFTWKKWYISTC